MVYSKSRFKGDAREGTVSTVQRSQVFTVVLFGLLAACGGEHDHESHSHDEGVNCADETRARAYAAGLEQVGSAGYRVRLLDAQPAPPQKGDNTWQFEVLDPSGMITTEVTVRVEPWMPDHGHGTPRIARVTTPAAAATRFSATPINLWMPGYWEIRLHLSQGDAPGDTVTFPFCVDG